MTKPDPQSAPTKPVQHEQRQDQPLKQIAETQEEARAEAESESDKKRG